VFVFLLFLLYSNYEEVVGEVKAFHTKIFPPSLPPAPTWNATRAAVATLPQLLPTRTSSTTTSSPSSSCHLPVLDPWHPAILPYVSDKPSLVCSKHQKSLVYIEFNSLVVNSTALEELNLLRSQVNCKFAYISLLSSDNYKFLPEEELKGPRVVLSSNYTSVLVTCSQVGGIHSLFLHWPFRPLYTNILPYLPRKPPKKTSDDKKKKYSVAILLIDSLSQLSLIRYLPRAKKTIEALGGVIFKGHHKIGHNSWPNVMALLGGERLPPWPLDLARSSCFYIDREHKPLLLKEFGDRGWTTLFLEDFQLYGLVREGTIGFTEAPGDHYYRSTYWPITKERGWRGGMRNRLVGKADNYACQQELPAYQHQFRILEDILMHQEGPTFSYFHLNEYTHNELAMARHYDLPLEQLVTKLSKAGALNDTFFLLLADHGFQRGDNPFVLTEQGTMENNMPAFLLLPPSSLLTDHPEMVDALRGNANRLSSHLDIYVTLRELLSMGSDKPLVDAGRGSPGKSLLHPIENRGCAGAGVPPQHCSCTEGRVKLEKSGLQKLARAILRDTDTLLQPLGLCRQLKLSEIREASLRPKTEGQKHSVLEMQLAVSAPLVEAVFQATIAISTNPPSLHRVTLTRMDWYSTTSKCLPSNFPHLRPYCICF